jgi:hypothetical protein
VRLHLESPDVTPMPQISRERSSESSFKIIEKRAFFRRKKAVFGRFWLNST